MKTSPEKSLLFLDKNLYFNNLSVARFGAKKQFASDGKRLIEHRDVPSIFEYFRDSITLDKRQSFLRWREKPLSLLLEYSRN